MKLESPAMRKMARFIAAFIMLVAIALACATSWIFITRDFGTTDFIVFYSAARLAVTGQGTLVYSRPALFATEHELSPKLLPQKYAPFLYPPPFLPFWCPLGYLNLNAGRFCWLFVMWASLLGSLLVLRRIYPVKQTASRWLVPIILTSGPLVWCVMIGQLATVLLFLFSLCILYLKRNCSTKAGLALAAICIKPHIALPFITFLLGARRYRPVAVMSFAVLVAALVSLTIFGPDLYSNFLQSMTANLTHNALQMNSQRGPTLKGVMMALFGNTAVVSTTANIVLLVVYPFFFWLGNRMKSSPYWLEAGLLGVLPLSLATGLHLQDYDILLLIPSVMFLLSQPQMRTFSRWLIATAALSCLMLVTPVYMEFHQRVKEGKTASPNFALLLIIEYAYLCFLKKHLKTFDSLAPDEGRENIQTTVRD